MVSPMEVVGKFGYTVWSIPCIALHCIVHFSSTTGSDYRFALSAVLGFLGRMHLYKLSFSPTSNFWLFRAA